MDQGVNSVVAHMFYNGNPGHACWVLGPTNFTEVTMAGEPPQRSDGAAAISCGVEQSQSGVASVVVVSGTVDALTAPQLQEAIVAAASSSPPAIVVDLTEVNFLASAGMGVLIAAHAELKPAVRLVIVADGPATSRPLKLVGVADVIDMFVTRDDALAAIAP